MSADVLAARPPRPTIASFESIIELACLWAAASASWAAFTLASNCGGRWEAVLGARV